jgi:hypothetical protein
MKASTHFLARTSRWVLLSSVVTLDRLAMARGWRWRSDLDALPGDLVERLPRRCSRSVFPSVEPSDCQALMVTHQTVRRWSVVVARRWVNQPMGAVVCRYLVVANPSAVASAAVLEPV